MFLISECFTWKYFQWFLTQLLGFEIALSTKIGKSWQETPNKFPSTFPGAKTFKSLIKLTFVDLYKCINLFVISIVQLIVIDYFTNPPIDTSTVRCKLILSKVRDILLELLTLYQSDLLVDIVQINVYIRSVSTQYGFIAASVLGHLDDRPFLAVVLYKKAH